AFVSPFRADRETVRSLFGEGEYVEVFVDLPADVAEERDTKGLYAKANVGAYEPPESPDVHLDMTSLDIEAGADRIVAALEERELL
ncbi:MAG: adenylyl-sulfate kinase, partial [Gaiellaceae bacterium]